MYLRTTSTAFMNGFVATGRGGEREAVTISKQCYKNKRRKLKRTSLRICIFLLSATDSKFFHNIDTKAKAKLFLPKIP